MTGDWTRKTAAELADALAAGEVTSVELTQAHLDRIAAVDGDATAGIHAFLHVDTEGALAQAAASDERRAAGNPLHPLDGVPIAVKDVLATAGAADDLWVQDPRGLDPAVRRDRRAQAQGGRPPDPRQDQHGRVRHGQLDRALGVRPDPQPVGPDPDPRRLRRWLGGGGGVLRGTVRDRHRHRRLDPAAGCGDGHRRREADVRRRVALRPDRARQQPRPGGAGHPDRARRRAAAGADRRARPARLDLGRPAAARRSSTPPARVRPATCPASGSASSPRCRATAGSRA